MSDEKLEYSDEAKITKVNFYSDFNDINLIVEDKGKEYVYETIFKRLLGKEYCIEKIHGVGGKQNVISAFKRLGNSTDGKNNYYILDGDFDRYIKPEEMISDSHVIYLETYNVESYFVDKNACYKFIKGKYKLLDDEIVYTVNFDYWLNRIIKESTKLFLAYAFIQKFCPSKPNVNRNVELFIDAKTGFERADGKYDEFYITEIKNDFPNATDEISLIAKKFEQTNGNNYFNLICGKFLIKSLMYYLRSKYKKCNFSYDDFEWFLINNFDIKKLDYVKQKLSN